ncbi:beta-galactosidase [Granulicella arctica]|uniref:Beta-galactosidase n=1 Tax=Granulicella arctica TaxID=940613 RepID=A0A7Y9PJZ4_9BACT|nr:beta-galactosidase [Granulicella arctica]NYF81323.1 hypothetical protein [Granulicella arctica]
MLGVVRIHPGLVRKISFVVIGVFIALHGIFMRAQTVSRRTVSNVLVDASQPLEPPQDTLYKTGSSLSPTGHRIGVNSRYLTLDGTPWLPVMGEFHYSRYPESEWESEILKMKAGGVQIISTYVIWIHHEEVEGEFAWTGQRDLRRFVNLCARHGLYVYLRIGPWVHGEVRNGGIPDWVMRKGPTRESNPDFLSYVQRFDRQIAQQIQGMMWKDGGPIIGIQLENEYAGKNREEAEQYILKLKRMAIENGMDTPLYSVTAWDNAVVPPGAVLPMYGGYPDAPWDKTLEDLSASEVYAFRFSTRLDGDAEKIRRSHSVNGDPREPYPFLTAEVGAGIQDTYRRRPVVSPDDIAAMCPVFLGSGVNLLGFYMYHGGENPDGRLSTLQESKATGYPTDVPVKSYDFQAPLSEFGDERPSFRRLKLFTYFLRDFGEDLAPMTVHAPSKNPESPQDLSLPRLSVRSSGESGFIFVNNHVRHKTMPSWKNLQVTIKLPHETLKVPDIPIVIPNGAYPIWPFNLDMKGIRLRYSTAQLFTKLEGSNETDYFFFAVPGVRPDFCFTDGTFAAVSGNVPWRRFRGCTLLENVTPGLASNIVVQSLDGRKIRVVLLRRVEAENAWKTMFAGQGKILFTKQQFIEDEKRIYLQSNGDPHFAFTIFPKISTALSGSAPIEDARSGQTTEDSMFIATLPENKVEFKLSKVRDTPSAPAVNPAEQNAEAAKASVVAPEADAFSKAAGWKISIDGYPTAALSDLFLQIDYAGDVARLSSESGVLTDNFFNGTPWVVGLKRFMAANKSDSIHVNVLPLAWDAPIKLETQFRPHLQEGSQIANIRDVKLISQYQLVIDKVKSEPAILRK